MARDTLQGLMEAFAEDAEEPATGDLSLRAGPLDADFGINGGSSSEGMAMGGIDDEKMGITENREENFSRESGRFHDPATGEFEPGSPPPDLAGTVDRYRGTEGEFKESPQDLYDEPEEVAQDSLEPQG